MKIPHLLRFTALAVAAVSLVSCRTAPDNTPQRGATYYSAGPATAFADAELFAENPLGAFQRTGAAPLPVGTYPVNTPVQIVGRSGAFYQVSMPDGRSGWMAARNLSGVDSSVPSVGAGEPGGGGAEVRQNTPSEAGGLPAPSHDTIDLDRIP